MLEHKHLLERVAHDFNKLVEQAENGAIASLMVEPVEGTSSCVVGYVFRDPSLPDPLQAGHNGSIKPASDAFDPNAWQSFYRVGLYAAERNDQGKVVDWATRAPPDGSMQAQAYWVPDECQLMDCERRAALFAHGFFVRNPIDGMLTVVLDAHVPGASNPQPSFRQWIDAADYLESATRGLPPLKELAPERQHQAKVRAGRDIARGVLPDYNEWLAGKTYRVRLLQVEISPKNQTTEREIEVSQGYYGLDEPLRGLAHSVRRVSHELSQGSDEAAELSDEPGASSDLRASHEAVEPRASDGLTAD